MSHFCSSFTSAEMESNALFFSSFSFLFLLLAASSLPASFAGGGGGAGGGDSEVLLKDADLIDELPNQPEDVEFRQYSGYIVAEPVVNRRYFYYFVEADDNRPLSKPLLIYISSQKTDGMGSSLLSCFRQVGPYYVEDDGQTLIHNPYSWNKFANILFVDGPTGVGFAMSDDYSKDMYGSQEYWFISEMYHFILEWMRRFPEYKNSEVYIAGQSYFGMIAPGLATYILYKNSVPGNPRIDIKGILLGNPRMDQDLEFMTRFESTFRMNLISEEINYDRRIKCDPRHYDFFECWKPTGDAQYSFLCLYPNNVYQQMCPNIDVDSVGLDNIKYKVYDCVEQSVAGYLNIPFVQTMMHVEQSTPWGPTTWQPYSWYLTMQRNITSTIPYVKAAMTGGVRILIYSGVQDEETIIPNFTVIKCMNLTISSEWRPWFDNNVQVAGFTESYVGGLTLATVRGAGLVVMADQPKRGFIIAKSFVTNSSLPFSKIA